MRLNKQKVIKAGLFDLPSFPEFQTSLSNCKENEVEKFEMFFIIKDQKVIINPLIWQTYCDQHSIIARTLDELELVKVWNEFLNSALKFHDVMKSKCDRIVFENLSPINMASWALPDNNGKLKINHPVFAMLQKKKLNKSQ